MSLNSSNKKLYPKKYTVEQFLKTESLQGLAISYDDSKILFSSDKNGVVNAFSINIETGVIKAETSSNEGSILPVAYFPADFRFLYQSDNNGDEIAHLYLQDERGKSTELTIDNSEKAHFFQWSPEEKGFFYESNKRDQRYMDLYKMDVQFFKSNLVFSNKEGYSIEAISPNDNVIALSKTVTNNDADMYIYVIGENNVKHITQHNGEIRFHPIAFSKDSKYLYFLTDENSEFLYLKCINVGTLETELVARENWDITFAKISPKNKYLIYGINNDAKTQIKIIELETGDNVTLPELPDGQVHYVNVSKSEKVLAFLLNTSTSPANLYVYHFEKGRLKQLTETLNPDIEVKDLVPAKVVRYPSYDGLEIPAIYYEPIQSDERKAPALVWVHGGPGGQSTMDYNPLFQYLVNQGYAILAVNNRGSSGYGKSFYQAADLKHGDVDLADCIKGKTFLLSTGKVDEERIGIIGGSYGGYMVLAALSFQPDAFKVGVDIFGVSNWERTLKNIPSWWEAMREALYKKLGNPYTQKDYIKSISPLFHADKINKPLIVLQGANDPRVLQVESDEIVESVKGKGVPVEYIVFEDEGHGFTKKKNQILGYKRIASFLNTYL